MKSLFCRPLQLGIIALGILLGLMMLNRADACDLDTSIAVADLEEIQRFFESQNKMVVTFLGYSVAEYEDKAAMLKQAARILDEFDPSEIIVNIGATPEGIGAIYNLAKSRGIITTGIVSTRARESNAELSSCADYVFFVEDQSWGGFVEGENRLSPTSEAMVGNSDVLIGIGGGEVARDELTAAKRMGKEVRFIPADMNHQKALEKAKEKGLPAPTSFGGAAGEAF